ncbi:cytokine receptor-like factor 3 isoform X1 [Portunus trituberculatus]|uniref:cytokine receptor-like factor 3 isoform X1 n=2 Tax=Portunus trituberculatus TaxID=210409 RepID=UPI001E1CD9C9|nr:cytokine receptor-like factor 3 isoform X1 [Portunus trituberculatus]
MVVLQKMADLEQQQQQDGGVNSGSGSSAGERLREEYRRHVQTQLSHDLVDAIASLQQHQHHLQQLSEQLELATKQVKSSATETKDTINATLDAFLVTVNEAVTARRHQLLDEVQQVEEEALVPLEQCGRELACRLDEVEERVTQGQRLQRHSGVMARDTVLRFQEEAAAMTSLPEVPALCAVPSVSVEFPSDPLMEEEVRELVGRAGRVSRMGPVQITNIVEQPGALLVSWEEVDEDVSDEGLEFCLECSNTGATDPHAAVFTRKYEGPDYSFLLRDLKAGENYLLRVASRREGASCFGPWSLVQAASTNTSHFKWGSSPTNASSAWTVADDGRLACKTSDEPEVLHSEAPLLKPGSSVLFKILRGGGGCSDEGLGLSCMPVMGPEHLLLPGTLFLSAQGCVFLDGVSRVTRLPAIQDKSQVSFAVEKVSSSKVRVYIESQEKQVTYEWGVPSAQDGLYFLASFGEPRWKISVH